MLLKRLIIRLVGAFQNSNRSPIVQIAKPLLIQSSGDTENGCCATGIIFPGMERFLTFVDCIVTRAKVERALSFRIN